MMPIAKTTIDAAAALLRGMPQEMDWMRAAAASAPPRRCRSPEPPASRQRHHVSFSRAIFRLRSYLFSAAIFILIRIFIATIIGYFSFSLTTPFHASPSFSIHHMRAARHLPRSRHYFVFLPILISITIAF